MYTESNPFPLETKFKYRKHQFNQVERVGKFAIFELEGEKHWELIAIKVMPPGEYYGMSYDWREVYPSDSQWGSAGWSHMSLEEAEKAMLKLIESDKLPKTRRGRPKKIKVL